MWFLFKVSKPHFHISDPSSIQTQVTVHYMKWGLQWDTALHYTLKISRFLLLHGNCPGKDEWHHHCKHLTVVPKVTCYSAALMYSAQSISQCWWLLHQSVCQWCCAYSLCLFTSNAVCSSLKEVGITLLCGSWCRYLRFSAVLASWCIFCVSWFC